MLNETGFLSRCMHLNECGLWGGGASQECVVGRRKVLPQAFPLLIYGFFDVNPSEESTPVNHTHLRTYVSVGGTRVHVGMVGGAFMLQQSTENCWCEFSLGQNEWMNE